MTNLKRLHFLLLLCTAASSGEGLGVSMRPVRAIQELGVPIEFVVNVKNNSKQRVEIDWGMDAVEHVSLTAYETATPETILTGTASDPVDGIVKIRTMRLEPGESDSETVLADRILRPSKPGTYTFSLSVGKSLNVKSEIRLFKDAEALKHADPTAMSARELFDAWALKARLHPPFAAISDVDVGEEANNASRWIVYARHPEAIKHQRQFLKFCKENDEVYAREAAKALVNQWTVEQIRFLVQEVVAQRRTAMPVSRAVFAAIKLHGMEPANEEIQKLLTPYLDLIREVNVE